MSRLQIKCLTLLDSQVQARTRRFEYKDSVVLIPAGSSIIFICAHDESAYKRALHRVQIALDAHDTYTDMKNEH